MGSKMADVCKHPQGPQSQPPNYPAPPAYNYHADYNTRSNYDYSATIPRTSPSPGRTLLFPPRLVYNTSWVSSTSHLGPSKEEPLFAVQHPSKLVGCFSRGEMTLRDGGDKHAPAIASVGPEKGSKMRRSMISIKPRPGDDRKGNLDVSMSGSCRTTQRFTLPADPSVGRGAETFEWRTSHGDEVKDLSGGFNWGWKLVRLDGPPVVPGQHRDTRGYTSDGKEVVAVGAHPRMFHKNPEFSFLGAGARGELGEVFEIAAVMGFLRIYDLAQQQAAGAAASSSASSSVAISV